MIPVWVAVAGGLGAAARFMLDGALTARLSRSLPTATLVINVLGSFLLGLVTGGIDDGAALRAALGVGFLGGFTTFSTASVEGWRLLRAGRAAAAALHAGGGLIAGVLAAFLGLWLMSL